MKKLLIFIIIAGLAVFGAMHFKNNSNTGEQIVYQGTTNDGAYTVKMNLPDWQKADTKGTQLHYMVKFTPLNDEDKNFGREIKITFYNSTMNYYPESQYTAYIADLRKMVARKTQAPLDVNVHSNSTNNITFDWSVKGLARSEVNRFVRTQRGLYMIQYSQEKEGVTDDEKETATKILKSFKEE